MKYTLEEVESNLRFWLDRLNESKDEETKNEEAEAETEETEEADTNEPLTVEDVVSFFDAQFDEAEDKDDLNSKKIVMKLDDQELNLDDISIEDDACVFTLSTVEATEEETDSEEEEGEEDAEIEAEEDEEEEEK